jgi:hypothetical protein
VKVPCEDCLVYPSCNDYCNKARGFMKKLDNDICKFEKYVKSNNGRQRKNLKRHKKLHYNHLVDTWNYSVKHLGVVAKRHFGFTPGDKNGRETQ